MLCLLLTFVVHKYQVGQFVMKNACLLLETVLIAHPCGPYCKYHVGQVLRPESSDIIGLLIDI